MPDPLPTPLLVYARTGQPAPPLAPSVLPHLLADLPGAAQRLEDTTTLAPDFTVSDRNDLTQTGWAALFASDADPILRTHLEPLLALRRQQVADPALFKIFEGPEGVLPDESAESWALRHGVALTAPVDPAAGVPYFLLLVGSPSRIPFEFQLYLKMQWAVGRLHFDDPADYARYAQALVAYEAPTFQPIQSKNIAVWVTRNRGNLATAMLSGAIAQGFLYAAKPLGSPRFTLDAFPDAQATKQQLLEIIRGNLPGGPPAVLFTGSHGTAYPAGDPDQPARQGALITQEWTEGAFAEPSNQFAAADIPPDARLHGLIAFLFACFSAGCPAEDSYAFTPAGESIPLAPQPIISALAQSLLAHGALAVLGHIDTAFADCFLDVHGVPQTNVLRSPLEYLMQGQRAGVAADSLTLTWTTLSSQVALTAPSAPNLAKLVIARDDARNFIVLGDPAARLRVSDLQ